MQNNNPNIIIGRKLKRQNIQHSPRRRNSDKSSNREYFKNKLIELDRRYKTLRNKYIVMLREKEWLEDNDKFIELSGNLIKAFENQLKYITFKSKNVSISEMKEQIREWSVYLDVAEECYAEVEKIRYSQAEIVTIWSGWSYGSLSCLNENSQALPNEDTKPVQIPTGLGLARENSYGELPPLSLIFGKETDKIENNNINNTNNINNISIVTDLEKAKRQLGEAGLPSLSSILGEDQKEELNKESQPKQMMQAELKNALNLFKKNWPSQPKRNETDDNLLFSSSRVGFFKFDEVKNITIEIIDPSLVRSKSL